MQNTVKMWNFLKFSGRFALPGRMTKKLHYDILKKTSLEKRIGKKGDNHAV